MSACLLYFLKINTIDYNLSPNALYHSILKNFDTNKMFSYYPHQTESCLILPAMKSHHQSCVYLGYLLIPYQNYTTLSELNLIMQKKYPLRKDQKTSPNLYFPQYALMINVILIKNISQSLIITSIFFR